MGCLLGVPVTGTLSPEALRAYTEAALKVPAAHWALVTSIEVGAADSTEKVTREGHLRLPPEGHQGQLWHGVGHLVGWRDDDKILNAFAARFWDGDRPIRAQPMSGYGARHGAPEDFPELYRCWMRGDRRSVKIAWLKAEVARS